MLYYTYRTSVLFNHMAFKEITMQPVSTQKFDELVASTTSYLQKLMDKTAALEKRIEVLEAKKGEKKDG